MEASRRATVRGPTFIRLLARLTHADIPQPSQPLSDRLSQWVDWTHSLTLSTALDATPLAAAPGERVCADSEAAECAKVRSALSQAIVGDRAFAAPDAAPPRADEPADYSFFRQRYLALQQTMEAGAGRLRERLRDRLSLGTPEMARLAAVDQVMERALARRERALLGSAPALLGEHFERLRLAAQDDAAAAPRVETWLDAFRRDMRGLLLAELDVRLQPAEGLLAALRTRA
ncbi:DUF3348 domain-containing protein [Lysobacter antibioticus]|uniref:DUF3348 domain-containing protein n=1 Tax=Lysobacter antibioticus TaxID=84531 RepID=UPI001C9833E5|nr:DUF3348 domain-containing protein [Lysobacter antibioticus]